MHFTMALLSDFDTQVQFWYRQSFFQEAMQNIPLSEITYTQELYRNSGVEAIMRDADKIVKIREQRAIHRLSDYTCHYCMLKDVPLKRCAQCHLVYYCSPTCQKKDWKEKHKHWCCNPLAELDHPEFLPKITHIAQAQHLPADTWVAISKKEDE